MTVPPAATPPIAAESSPAVVAEAGAPAMAMLDASHAVADMVGFIERYDGGPCFTASPTRITKDSAVIDTFSDSEEPIQAFNAAFFAGMGLDPDVTGQKVNKAQCPAVEFLKAAHGGAGTAPTLELDRRDLKGSEILSGRVARIGGRSVMLLLVSEKGVVEDVTQWLSPRPDARTFAVPMGPGQSGGPFVQMLLVIAARSPLSPSSAPMPDRSAVFRPLIERAAHDPESLQATGKAFRLVR